MNENGWVIASVIVVILGSLLSLTGGVWVVWKTILSRPNQRRPAMAYLLLTIILLSFSQVIEQGRVLATRMVQGGYRGAWVEWYAYVSPIMLPGAKLLIACALTFATILKIAIYKNLSSSAALKAASLSSLLVIVIWLWIALAVDFG